MYGVNASIPKTLVRHLVRYYADTCGDGELSALLTDVLDTPVSPELLPPEDGKIAQKTEDLVGPYELHDFFLYYVLRFGFRPGKIFRLAKSAFSGVYEEDVILHWLEVFYRRFFSQQFKRSCLPDGAEGRFRGGFPERRSEDAQRRLRKDLAGGDRTSARRNDFMITSTKNQQVRWIIELNKKAKTRNEAGLFAVEGIRMAKELPLERTEQVYVSESFLKDPENRKLLERFSSYEETSDPVFAAMSDTRTPQGILALVRKTRIYAG